MKLLLLLLLIGSVSFAQSTQDKTIVTEVTKEIVGYWKLLKSEDAGYSPFEDFVLYESGKYVIGDQQMMCQGTWELIENAKKELLLILVSNKACGSESQKIRVIAHSKVELQLSLISNTKMVLERQQKKPWKKSKMEAQVLGIWNIESPKGPAYGKQVGLIVEKDSFSLFDGGGPIKGPWELTEDGRYLVLKLAEEPMVSISAAYPAHAILPLSNKDQNWNANLEKSSYTKAKNKSIAKLKKKVIGTWQVTEEFQGEKIVFKQVYKQNGTLLFTIESPTRDTKSITLAWEISPEGEYMKLMKTEDRRYMELVKFAKDKNRKLVLSDKAHVYKKQ